VTDTGAVLEASSVEFSYGRLQVLFDVSLSVGDGEILALLGTNGAGKSTLLRVLGGLETPARGSVRFNGQDVTGVPAERRAGMGLVLVPGGKGVFPSLTVMDNLRAGAFTFIYEKELLRYRLDDVLSKFPVLASKLGQTAGSLSGGEQHMLALAKALLLEPSVLLIDELTGGLAPQVVDELLGLLTSLRDGGTTLVLVEQSLNIAAAVADRALFLEKGTLRFEGSPRDLLDRPDLARAVFLAGSA
jgi:ABC-type branched-subunit amino acid transport system ATPase component